MNRSIVILILVSFLVSWTAPLSTVFAGTNGSGHASIHSSYEGSSHYCEISKGPCKHKDACPLKDHHGKNSDDQKSKIHKHDGKDDAGVLASIRSTCHLTGDTHHASIFIFDDLFITTLLLPPLGLEGEGEFQPGEAPGYIDNISSPIFRPPQHS